MKNMESTQSEKPGSGALAGKSVLVVEDEMLVALEIERILGAAGSKVLGPVASIAEATAIIEAQAVDLALLDINVRGEFIYPLTKKLAERNIKFVFSTGYDEVSIPSNLRQTPCVRKPFTPEKLIATLSSAV